MAKVPFSEPALGPKTWLGGNEAAKVQYVMIQCRLVILLGLLNMLMTVSDLVLLFMFSFLVTVCFGLSQQVARCELLSRHDVLDWARGKGEGEGE